MHRYPARLVGVALIAVSGASTLAHRSVYEATRHGPAQIAELALGLLTFMLASVGILMLIHGGKLFERPTPDELPEHPTADIATGLMEPIKSQGRAYDTRYGASLMQARHAIRVSRKLEACDKDGLLARLAGRRSFLSNRR